MRTREIIARSFLSKSGMVFGAATLALMSGQLLRRSAYRTLSARTGAGKQKTTANPKQRGAER
jgi:hypothetical protein